MLGEAKARPLWFSEDEWMDEGWKALFALCNSRRPPSFDPSKFCSFVNPVCTGRSRCYAEFFTWERGKHVRFIYLFNYLFQRAQKHKLSSYVRNKPGRSYSECVLSFLQMFLIPELGEETQMVTALTFSTAALPKPTEDIFCSSRSLFGSLFSHGLHCFCLSSFLCALEDGSHSELQQSKQTCVRQSHLMYLYSCKRNNVGGKYSRWGSWDSWINMENKND